MNKKLIIGILIVVVLVILITTFKTTGLITLNNQDTIKIGGAFALTGFASEWGSGELRAAELAIQEINSNGGINGTPIKLIVEDTQAEALGTVNAFNKLINIDQVDVIIGSTWLESFIGAAEIAEQNKVLTISPSSSISIFKEKEFDYVYTTWFREDYESEYLLDYFSKNNIKDIVFLFSNEPYWLGNSGFLKEYLDKYNINLIYEFKYNTDRMDFRTELIKIKKLNPDAIVFGSDNENSIFSIIKQAKELDFDVSSFYSYHSAGIFAEQNNTTGIFDGVKYVTPVILDSEFTNTFYNIYPEDPSPSITNTYDAIMILAEVLRNTDTPEEAIEYLNSNSFNTITFGNNVSFDSLNGLFGGEFEIKEIS